VLIASLVLILAPTLVFAGGFNLAGAGMKGLSMSGAYRAISDDWSAMYWNPAGLAGQSSGFWIEAKVLYPNTRITPDTPNLGGSDYYSLYRNGVEQSSVNGGRPTGSIALQWQFNDKLTAGISAFTPSALGANWEGLYTGPYGNYGNDPDYPTENWESSMYVIDIHPTIGYQVTDQLAVGVGLGIKISSIELRSPALVPGLDDDGDQLPLPMSYFFADATLSGSGVGVGFNVGLMYDVTDDFTVGFSYIGPSTIPIEGTVSQDVYLPYLVYADGPYTSTLSAEPDAKADFPLPMEAGLGFAYAFSNNFTAAFDARWTNWAALDVITIEMDGAGPDGMPADDSELVLNWEDTISYHLGFMWDTSDAVQLRAGYYFDPTPIPTETMRPTITDVADKHSVSLGLGYDFGNGLTFDATYQHLVSGDNEAPASDNDGDGLYDNVPGTWSMQVLTFGAQLGYRF